MDTESWFKWDEDEDEDQNKPKEDDSWLYEFTHKHKVSPIYHPFQDLYTCEVVVKELQEFNKS